MAGTNKQAALRYRRNDGASSERENFSSAANALTAHDRERLHFVAMAAHDLKTPLSVIGGAAHYLRGHRIEISPEEQDEWLDCIIRSATSLQVLADDLMDGVRARSGQLELRREEVDLTALAREAVRDYGAAMRSHPLHFEDGGACFVIGDRERLKRLLLNLLSNAVTCSEKGREVSVAVWRRGANVCLVVQDGGKGRHPSRRSGCFSRSHASTTRASTAQAMRPTAMSWAWPRRNKSPARTGRTSMWQARPVAARPSKSASKRGCSKVRKAEG